MLPSSLRRVSFRRLRCPRGKSLALLIGEFLQSLCQALAPPLTTLRNDFALDFGQTRKRLLWYIHMSTVLPLVRFMSTEECQPTHYKNSVKMRTISLRLKYRHPAHKRVSFIIASVYG